MGFGFNAFSLLQDAIHKHLPSSKKDRLNIGCFGYQDVILEVAHARKLLADIKGADPLVLLARLGKRDEWVTLPFSEFEQVLLSVCPTLKRDKIINRSKLLKVLLRKWFGMKLFRFDKEKVNKLGMDEGGYLKWLLSSNSVVFETASLFESLFNCSYMPIDIISHTGTETLMNLNLPVEDKYHEKFDVVIDGGTMEHCFNPPTVLSNMVRMVKPNGLVYHVTPMTWPNHGFYNFSPCLFHEFYQANGFKVLYSQYGFNSGNHPLQDAPSDGYFALPPEKTVLFFIARKEKQLSGQAIKAPIQGVYQSYLE